VEDDRLVVEEKAIYSIEKFLLSRRIMYWQVYLHKTVVAAEKMLIMVIRRAKELIARGETVQAATFSFNTFLHTPPNQLKMAEMLDDFCQMDDYDVMATVKNWCRHPDFILSTLCKNIVQRKIMHIKLQAQPIDKTFREEKIKETAAQIHMGSEELPYFILEGEATNRLYNLQDESINILYKDGVQKDISQVDNALINIKISEPVKKYYFCWLRI